MPGGRGGSALVQIQIITIQDYFSVCFHCLKSFQPNQLDQPEKTSSNNVLFHRRICLSAGSELSLPCTRLFVFLFEKLSLIFTAANNGVLNALVLKQILRPCGYKMSRQQSITQGFMHPGWDPDDIETFIPTTFGSKGYKGVIKLNIIRL